MPQPIEEKAETTEEVVPDVFGENEVKAVEVKKEENAEKKEYPEIPEDHPTIKALQDRIEQVKSEYGSNLSGQREVIKRLEDEIKSFKESGGKTEEDKSDLPFPEVKFSKDLTDEEKEEYSTLELQQMDAIAKMQEMENNRYLESKKNEKEVETKKVEDIQKSVKDNAYKVAQEVSGQEDITLANKIIESVKRFNLNGLTEKEIAERVQDAYKLLPEYTPAKEQVTTKGAPVTKGSKSDPFGVDAIVDEVINGGSEPLTL